MQTNGHASMETVVQAALSHEKIPVSIFKDRWNGAVHIAQEIASVIRARQKKNEAVVLGLASGSSMITVYQALVHLHRHDNLSFRNVIAFNVEEYYTLQPQPLQSVISFLQEHLFRHVDIRPDNIHLLQGAVAPEKMLSFCQEYESRIQNAGGIDIQLLGIGYTGSIGFNEPGSGPDSVTRMVRLDPVTIAAAAPDFIREEFVPIRALTMGIGTILQAKKIILLAWGETKADILKKAVEENRRQDIPASFLQLHSHATVVADEQAASALTRIRTPWLVGTCFWNDKLIRRAVIWLSRKNRKPILKLTDEDYKDAGLMDLLAREVGHNLNMKVFNDLQQTITRWPGGKFDAGDTLLPERAFPAQKRTLIFSPLPYDDVTFMGGTLLRLVEQGHDVHIAYQTNGNISVYDDDALRFARFAEELSLQFDWCADDFRSLYKETANFLEMKEASDPDNERTGIIKRLIRKGEAEAACRYCGVKSANVHFLNLPFYDTGAVRQNTLSEKDIRIVAELLRKIKPHQVFAAADPQELHGTHAVCLEAILNAIESLRGEPWLANCYVWLYRSLWQEWDIEDIEMAVSLSPEELKCKRNAIFKHPSQRDSPGFPGDSKSDFWYRAEERNRSTARLYDQLGLAEYEAIEAFVRLKLKHPFQGCL